MKKYFCFFLIIFTLLVTNLGLATTQPSPEMLDLITQGLGKIVQGDISQLKDIDSLEVSSISQTDKTTNVTFNTLTTQNTLTIVFTSQVLDSISLHQGQMVRVILTETGYLLTTENHPLTFIPNAEGQKLIHSYVYS